MDVTDWKIIYFLIEKKYLQHFSGDIFLWCMNRCTWSRKCIPIDDPNLVHVLTGAGLRCFEICQAACGSAADARTWKTKSRTLSSSRILMTGRHYILDVNRLAVTYGRIVLEK